MAVLTLKFLWRGSSLIGPVCRSVIKGVYRCYKHVVMSVCILFCLFVVFEIVEFLKLEKVRVRFEKSQFHQ